jgi:hypothetical protein
VPDELGNAKKEQKNDLGALKCWCVWKWCIPFFPRVGCFLGSIMNDSGFQDIQKSKTNPCNIDRPLGTRFRRQTHENAQNLQETPRFLEKNVPCQSSFYSPENINNCLINTVTAWRISSCRCFSSAKKWLFIAVCVKPQDSRMYPNVAQERSIFCCWNAITSVFLVHPKRNDGRLMGLNGFTNIYP